MMVELMQVTGMWEQGMSEFLGGVWGLVLN